MATIHYCDWVTGSDDTGDGSPQKPFKTILCAREGLDGGDEIRVAQTENPRTPLDMNINWTDGDNFVTVSGDVRNKIPNGTMIGKAIAGPPGSHETFYEVTGNSYDAGTNLTTFTFGTNWRNRYVGKTETADSIQLNPTNCGDGSGWNMMHGLGAYAWFGHYDSQLTISGGWNLATEERTGETWYSSSNRQGIGFSWGPRFATLEHMGFVKHDLGFRAVGTSWGWTVRNCTFVANNGIGAFIENIHADCKIQSCVIQGYSRGIEIQLATFGVSVEDCLIMSSEIGILGAAHTQFVNCDIVHQQYSVRLGADGAPLQLFGGTMRNTSIEIQLYGGPTPIYPKAIWHNRNNVEGDYLMVGENCTIVRDATIFHSGTSSLKISPTNLNVPGATATEFDDMLIAPCIENRPLKLSIHLRKSVGFNGEVALGAYISRKEVVAPTPVSISATDVWEKHSITIPANKVHETGPVASLRVYVKGNVGNIWVDTLEWE